MTLGGRRADWGVVNVPPPPPCRVQHACVEIGGGTIFRDRGFQPGFVRGCNRQLLFSVFSAVCRRP